MAGILLLELSSIDSIVWFSFAGIGPPPFTTNDLNADCEFDLEPEHSGF